MTSRTMARLEILITDVTGIEITVMVQDLSEAARNIRSVDKKLDEIADAQRQTESNLHNLSITEGKRFIREQRELEMNEIKKLDSVEDASFDSSRNERHQRCAVNTRTDILQQITSWATDDTSQKIFWLGGIAGTGKSTIAKTIAQRLQKEHDFSILSFFFERGAGEAGHSQKLIRTLAFQMAILSEQLRHYISEAIAQNERLCGSIALSEQLEELMLKPLRKWRKDSDSFLPIIVILDALDECADMENVQRFFQHIGHTTDLLDIGLRVFVTSRPETRLEPALENMTTIRYHEFSLHNVSCEAIDADIRTFLERELGEIKRIRKREIQSTFPHENQVTRLVEQAAGLFIFASTACKFIKNSSKRPARTLDEICRGTTGKHKSTAELDFIYTSVLKSSIEGQDDDEDLREEIAFTRQVLGNFIILCDNLSIIDFEVFLGEEITESDYSIHSVFDRLQAIIYVASNGLVRLIHQSFHDFLVDEARCEDSRFLIDEKLAHRQAVLQCLAIMRSHLHENMCHLSCMAVHPSEVDRADIDRYIPIALRYACRHWLQHVIQGDYELTDGCEVHDFLSTCSLHFFETMGLLSRSGESISIFRRLEGLIEVRVRERSTKVSC